MCGSSFGCIDHKEEFKEIVSRREGGLYDEYCRTSDAFVVAWLEFAVTECEHVGVSYFEIECLCDLECELPGRLTSENFDFVFVLHIVEGLIFVQSFKYGSYVVKNLLASCSCLR